jgi:hypothetical protein
LRSSSPLSGRSPGRPAAVCSSQPPRFQRLGQNKRVRVPGRALCVPKR